MADIDTYTDDLDTLLEDGRLDELTARVNVMSSPDVADFIRHLDEDERGTIFALLRFELAADVLAELGPAFMEDVLDTLSAEHIADLAEEMDPDDAADLVSELEPKRGAEVLAAMEQDERDEVTELLKFDEDEAGHIMTPEILAMPPSATVAQARERMRSIEMSDPIIYVYVVEPRDHTLIGTVPLAKLITASPHESLRDLADRDFVFARTDDDQEDVARMVRKYNLLVVPVLDENHRLVGRITVDDILDVVVEEADEDLAHMLGAPDIETDERGPISIARQRLPWLLITMFAGLANSLVIRSMMDVTNIAAVAIFVPAILAMGGNTGMQAAAVCVRGIALGTTKYSQLLQIMLREISVGFTLGVVCGITSGVTVWSVLTFFALDTGGPSPALLALIVGASMANAMTFASSFGAFVPLLLHRLKVDPAIASGPFVTTSNDLSATFIYFLTCLLLLQQAPAA